MIGLNCQFPTLHSLKFLFPLTFHSIPFLKDIIQLEQIRTVFYFCFVFLFFLSHLSEFYNKSAFIMMNPELVCLTFEFSKHFNVKFMSLLRREMFYFITTPISFLLDRTVLFCPASPTSNLFLSL